VTDWTVLSSAPSAQHRRWRGRTILLHASLFILGVLALNLTDGLWAVVPIVDAAAILASLSVGVWLAFRPTSREVGRGVLAGSFGAFGLEAATSAVLLFGWLGAHSS
jgi:hypothetical protein